MIDVVPRLCGTFKELAPVARHLGVRGRTVLLAQPSTVLARLDGSRRKGAARQRELETLRREKAAGRLGEADSSALVASSRNQAT